VAEAPAAERGGRIFPENAAGLGGVWMDCTVVERLIDADLT
jgi:hypothetical protein